MNKLKPGAKASMTDIASAREDGRGENERGAQAPAQRSIALGDEDCLVDAEARQRNTMQRIRIPSERAHSGNYTLFEHVATQGVLIGAKKIKAIRKAWRELEKSRCSWFLLDRRLPDRRFFKDELGGHRDRRLQTSIDRALVGKNSVHTSGSLPMSIVSPKSQPYVNAPDHEYILLQFDLSHSFPHQLSSGCIDLTRLQRASKSSRQSTRRGRNNVIERGSSWVRDGRRNLVMLGDRAVDSKDHRLGFSRQIGFTNRSFDALDSDFGTIDNS